MNEIKTTSPRFEKDFGKTRDGQKMVLSVTVRLTETCGLRDRQSQICNVFSNVGNSHADHPSGYPSQMANSSLV